MRLLAQRTEPTSMPHRYKVREIAQQSGLSEATVDRVLNERPGVRENTRAEVMQAIADLDKQRAQLRLVGRRYLIDVVMQTPQRFSDAFRAAVEAELPAFAPAMVRARFHLWESGSTAQMADAEFRRLVLAIRSATGIEALVWLTDIAGLSRPEAVELMCWSAHALLRSALADFGVAHT